MSALFRACEEGHAPCVTILIQAKADVNLADKSGRTPAYVCAQLNKTSCLEALIIGADPNLRQRNNNGRSPLMIARAMRNYWRPLCSRWRRLSTRRRIICATARWRSSRSRVAGRSEA